MSAITISGKKLTIEDVCAVANHGAVVQPLEQKTKERMNATQKWLEQAIQKQDTVFYGINTGFGSHANETIDPQQAGQLSRNVILADVAGIGKPLPEEIVRAKSHIQQFRALMEDDTPAGRPLNFLLQELNREVNTMGSKTGHTEMAHTIVTVKSELEKIREQIQNIE